MYFLLYGRLLVHLHHYKWPNFIPFCGWVISHWIYVPHLLCSFICRWTSRLLPCPSYCKKCCSEPFGTCVFFNYGFLRIHACMAQRVKHLPAMQETWVRSLCQEDPLEKEMATHSSTLAWKIPWTKKPGRLQSMGSQRVRHDWATSLSLSLFRINA